LYFLSIPKNPVSSSYSSFRTYKVMVFH